MNQNLLMNVFLDNKLLLNAKEKKTTNHVLFHKVFLCDSVPLRLPTMAFNNIEIKRENSVKFLGVIIDENYHGKIILKS